jgi:hypothetical protein
MWMLTLPIGKIENPRDVMYPEILSYTDSKYFKVVNGSIALTTPVNGVSTENSKYPRTELREMADFKTRAFWNTSNGRHVMHFGGSVTILPTSVPRVSIAQVYCENDDVVQIRSQIKNKTTTIYVTNNGTLSNVLDNNYRLTRKFNISIFIENNVISVLYNNKTSAVVKLKKSLQQCYFKVGTYPQYFNISSNEKAEVTLSNCNVTHIY